MTTAIAAVGGITIDEVVGADGTYADELLGGNALYSAWAMSLWLAPGQATVVGRVGADFPMQWLRDLDAAGIDVSSVTVLAGRATPVWRMAYADGDHRSDISSMRDAPAVSARAVATVPVEAGFPGELEPRLDGDEPVLDRVAGVHCGPVQPEVLLGNLAAFDRHDLVVMVDPGEESAAWDETTRRDVLARTDVYCPSLDDLDPSDTRSPADAAAGIARFGPHTVVVKLGTAGSFVHTRGCGLHIPAAPATVSDPTGAGDSYCGAFLAAFVRFRDAFVAGVVATATASLAVERSGLLDCLRVTRIDARDRARAIAQSHRHSPAVVRLTVRSHRCPSNC